MTNAEHTIALRTIARTLAKTLQELRALDPDNTDPTNDPVWQMGRAAGMREAATIVQQGHEIPDELDNGRSTIRADFDDAEQTVDAILAAI